MRQLANWWDALELWVTQLVFGFQILLVIAVLIPLCALAAVGLDRLTARFDAGADPGEQPPERT